MSWTRLLSPDAPSGNTGVWAALHDGRTDLSMLLGSIFLLRVGAGPLSVDAVLSRKLSARGSPR